MVEVMRMARRRRWVAAMVLLLLLPAAPHTATSQSYASQATPPTHPKRNTSPAFE